MPGPKSKSGICSLNELLFTILCKCCSNELEHLTPCPYLTTFHGAFTNEEYNSITLILELMDGGELQEFVDDGVLRNPHILMWLFLLVM